MDLKKSLVAIGVSKYVTISLCKNTRRDLNAAIYYYLLTYFKDETHIRLALMQDNPDHEWINEIERTIVPFLRRHIDGT